MFNNCGWVKLIFIAFFALVLNACSEDTSNSTTPSYTIGGTITGLAGTGLVLQNNGSDDLAISVDGNFAFNTALADGSNYNVTVLTQPGSPNQICSVTNGSGSLARSNITNITISCVTNTYTISGTVTGLAGTGLALQNNGSDDLAISVDGNFTFNTALVDGSNYNVTVLTQPGSPNQTCSVTNGSGTLAGNNVTNVSISCVTSTYTVGGSITGLSGSGLVLQNNLGDDLTFPAGTTSFTFNTAIPDSNSYSVAIKTQPTSPNQVCSVTNGTGSVTGNNITTVSINCVTSTYTIGGTVTGLTGSGLVLQNNGSDDLAISANGNFTFNTALTDGSNYFITVLTQPVASNQTCKINNGSGQLSGINVTNISVSCATPILDAEALPRSARLSWADTGAESYNLYYSTAPACDISSYTSCTGGTMLSNVTSPYTATGLNNGQNYWFRLESVTSGGNALSAEQGVRPDKLAADGTVKTIVHGADGTTYIGGNFTQLGIITGNGAPIDADSGRPGAFAMVQGGGISIRTAISDGNGGWYIGGDFTMVGGVSRNGLAHILADGTLGNWNPGANALVNSMAISGNTIYLGGFFTTINGQPRNHLAAIGTDGTLSSWNPDTDFGVNSLAVSGNIIYVGGQFTTVNGQTRNRLAAINIDGTLESWNPDSNHHITSLAILDTTVYVSGFFTTVNGQPRNYLAAINTDGTLDSWQPTPDDFVTTLTASNGTVYVGGAFTSISGQFRSHLAAISTNGTILNAWVPFVDNEVNSISVAGSTVYIGGMFTSVNGQTRNHLAAINTDGTLSSWNPSLGGIVHAIAVSGNKVYAGGSFISMGGTTRKGLAAINPDGTLNQWSLHVGEKVSGFEPGLPGSVNSLAISGDTLYVGGDFYNINGYTRIGLASINTNGTLNDWNPATSFGWINSLHIDGNRLYVGGYFSSMNGESRSNLAAFNTDGTLEAWSPAPNAWVNTISVLNSTVYIGGWFSTVNGTQRLRAAAINTDGTLSDWNPTFNDEVYTLTATTNSVYAGGVFQFIGGQQQSYFAAINLDGTLSSWNPGVSGVVRTTTVANNLLYIGGYFGGIGGLPRNGVAAFNLDGTLSDWSPLAIGEVYALSVTSNAVHVGGNISAINNQPVGYFDVIAP